MPTKGNGKTVGAITSKELAERSGETYDTIYFWTEKGLLSFRVHGRKRLYPVPESLNRCRKIRALQQKFPIRTIREMLDSPLDRTPD